MVLDPLVVLTARYALGGVFAVSATAKFLKLQDFVGIVANYRVLPGWAVRPVAMAIPPMEALLAVGFISRVWLDAVCGIAWVLLAVFTAAIVINLVRGRTEIDCGCLGPLLRQRIGWWMVVRNAVLMGIVGLVHPVWISAGRTYGLADVVFGGLAALVLLILYGAFQLLWTQTPREVSSR
ncbi:Methylamine utilization protein MauE [bacterium HR11]|nr:Methylamine utilization protein MauE [bacterium HR11]